MPPKSNVWRHFERNPDKTGTCRFCGVLVKTSGNTSNLQSHLQRKHPEVLQSPNPGPSAGKIRLVSAEWAEWAEAVVLVSEEEEEAGPNLERERPPEPGPSAARPQLWVRQENVIHAYQNVKSLKEGDGERHRLTQAIAYMVCKDSHPFDVVERTGFKRFLKVLAPQYTVPTRKTVEKHVLEKYDALSTIMRERLANKQCSLTMDTWTDEQSQTFLSLTAHYYDDEDELISATLGVVPLEERGTSDVLAAQLKEWCDEWGIRPETDDVTAVITDNDASIKEAAELAFGKEKHIPCFARTLGLVMEACLGIQTVSPLLSKAKAVVAWFKHNAEASDELKMLSGKKLIRSVPNKCNSTYHMLQRLIELRPHVSEIIDCHPSAPPMLTAPELEDAGEIIEILKPFEAATKLLVEERYLSSSIVIPVTSIILAELEKLHPNKGAPLDVLIEAVDGMKTRLGAVEHVFLLAVATLLDPRFKKMYFRDPTALSVQVTFLKNCLNKDFMDRSENNDSSSSSMSEDAQKPSNYLFRDHNKTVQKDWQRLEESSRSPMPEELSFYLGTPPEKIQENPLSYWKEMQTTYPNLTKVARRYLTTVATSVPPERLFSKFGEFESKLRERIKARRLPQLLFLQSADDRLWELK